MEISSGMQADIFCESDDDENGIEDIGQLWEFEDTEPERESAWRVRIKYFNGIEQEIPYYDDQLIDRSEELYFCLSEYLELEE